LASVRGIPPAKITLEAKKYSLGCYEHGFRKIFSARVLLLVAEKFGVFKAP
jgi:hypothetical protein